MATLNDSDREVFAGISGAGAGWCWLGRVNVSNGFNNPHKNSPSGAAPATELSLHRAAAGVKTAPAVRPETRQLHCHKYPNQASYPSHISL